MNHTTPAPVRFPSTPVSTSNRVWETRHPPSQDFHIWEGPNTGHTTSPIQQDQYSSFSPQDEDKENIFSIRSDLSSSGDEAQQSLTLNQGATNPRDAFGIPLAHQISDFVEGSNTSPTANLPVRPERQVLRPIWVPVPEDPEEPAEQ
jgi:hypothetical protein